MKKIFFCFAAIFINLSLISASDSKIVKKPIVSKKAVPLSIKYLIIDGGVNYDKDYNKSDSLYSLLSNFIGVANSYTKGLVNSFLSPSSLNEEMPFFNKNLYENDKIEDLLNKARNADALIIIVPTIMGGLGGYTKTILEWLCGGGDIEKSVIAGKCVLLVSQDKSFYDASVYNTENKKITLSNQAIIEAAALLMNNGVFVFPNDHSSIADSTPASNSSNYSILQTIVDSFKTFVKKKTS